jgi:hypothetical protein
MADLRQALVTPEVTPEVTPDVHKHEEKTNG